jgi:hypothetical protein
VRKEGGERERRKRMIKKKLETAFFIRKNLPFPTRIKTV